MIINRGVSSFLVYAWCFWLSSVGHAEPAASGATLTVPTAKSEAPHAVPQAHAARGLQWLMTKPYFEADFGPAEFNDLWTIWPDALKEKATSLSPLERRRLAFSRYGFVEAPSRRGEGADQPPLGFVDDGKGGWAMNCLFCHGGKVAGQAIPGVGNSHLAFQTLVQDSVKYQLSRKVPVSGEMMSRLLTPMGRSNGTTNAQIFSVALTAMRDPELNFTRPKGLLKLMHHDLDAPPLWNTKLKSRLYIDGYVQKSHRVIMQFVFVPGNDSATIKSWEGDFADILAWIEALEPPKYPWPIDAKLAEKGKVAFETNCAECHGTYGETIRYPEATVPLAEIGTDPVRWHGMPPEHRRFFRDGWIGEYGKLAVEEKPEGYVAPPLCGVWASAPYFHNGAVPTLWHVLNPSNRPGVWRRTEDGYDRDRVGLETTSFSALPPEVKDPAEQRTYFDTHIYGKSAAGHDYPNALTEDEKSAVLEYLKTL